MPALRVFVSYSTADLTYATTVKQLLESVGFSVFLAEYTLPPGAPLDATIIQAIRQADLLLLIWSKNAHASEWVRDEVGVAIGAHKGVLPVTLDPGTKMPAFVRGLKYIDASRDQMASLPVIQKSLIDYSLRLQEYRKAIGQLKSQEQSWDGLKTIAAVIGVAATLSWLGKQ